MAKENVWYCHQHGRLTCMECWDALVEAKNAVVRECHDLQARVKTLEQELVELKGAKIASLHAS